ncbi:MAG: HAMP domain-containing protein [Candidatus Schekmanbacteria bacterium]|nr:HAMP domain-containing protein [Candidatus Schekmanbacteria bacterium]
MIKLNTIYSKIVLAIFIYIIIISTIILSFTALLRKATDDPSFYKKETSREIQLIGHLLQKKIRVENGSITNRDEIESFLENIATRTSSDFRILLSNGNVLLTVFADKSHSIPFSEENITTLIDEINSSGSARRYLMKPKGEILFSTILTSQNENIILLQGKHQAYYPEERKYFVWAMLITSILVLTLMAFPISRNITNPIKEIIGASQKIADGEFGYTVNVKSGDEIGVLASNFNVMSEKLAKLYQHRRELVADISHELRSPLTRIQTEAEILIDKKLDREKTEKYLNDISEEVKSMDNLIRDLLDFSKMDLGQCEFDFQTIDLASVIEASTDKFETIAKQKDIRIGFSQKPSTSLYIKADEPKIRQVLSNIISNAIRHTEQNGNIFISVETDGANAKVTVKDTGHGIPAEDLPRIFERFYRVDKSRSRDSGGSGLGLAISKKIIEFHKGRIWAESSLVNGTSIIFTIPLI